VHRLPNEARRLTFRPEEKPGDPHSSLVDYRHASEKFGTPKQEWKTPSKALWMLYVLKEATGSDEFSNANIVSTFNKHFKQAGNITYSNSVRDLGNMKVKERPALVSENAGKTPPT
jgi:hypothetical protein